jgi:hypothetical protein
MATIHKKQRIAAIERQGGRWDGAKNLLVKPVFLSVGQQFIFAKKKMMVIEIKNKTATSILI